MPSTVTKRPRSDWTGRRPSRSAAPRSRLTCFNGLLDRALPIAHAEALGAGIAGASLTIVDDMGHIPRPGDWMMIAEQIVALNRTRE